MKNTFDLRSYGLLKLATVLTAVGLLTACGSGGSDSGQTQSKAPLIGNSPPAGTPVKPVLKDVFSNFAHPNFLPVNAVDGDPSTFMTTFQLNAGDVRIISLEFEAPSNLESISFEDNYSNQYALGNLEIQISIDSTNGLDGNWQTIKALSAGANDFVDGEGTIAFSNLITKWIRLKMTYMGSGAYGASPSFYLSEVSFN